jgi:asparagine synthase (glutamine-hydrolysing)
MASSLEVRVPMLDREMVAFADGLPAKEKRDKALLRAWAARHFPRELAERPKKGFGAPLAQWFRGPLRTLLRDTLAPGAVARDGFFQPAAVQRLLDDHERGRRDERKRLFNLLMFTLWYRTFRA